MNLLVTDLRLAVRQWRRTPVLAGIMLLSLVLGIGASLTLFSLVDAILLATLPVQDPQRLVRLVTPRGDAIVSNPVWEHIRDTQPVFASAAGVATSRVNLARGGEGRFVSAALVSGGFFDTLGLRPQLGRALDRQDDHAGTAAVAIIGHGLWQRDYAGAADVLGERMWINGEAFAIVGVLPRRFRGLEVGRATEVIVPLAAEPLLRGTASQLARPRSGFIAVYGRLAAQRSLGETAAAWRAWFPALREATRFSGPGSDQHLADPLDVVSAARGASVLRRQYRQPLLFLFSGVSLVLAIVCTNLSALVLARFSDRTRELSIRSALGASRARLVRALIVESLLLAGVGAAAGLLLAQWAAPVLARQLATPALRGLAPQIDVALDARLIGVALGLALLSGLAAGLVPALRASRVDPLKGLSGAADAARGRHVVGHGLRGLVVCQIALSLTLVTGAALLVRSFAELTLQDPGVDADAVLVAAVTGDLGVVLPDGRPSRIDMIAARLSAIPGVQHASGSVMTPLSGMVVAADIEVPGSAANAPAGAMLTFNSILPDYFAALGTPLLAGRDFTAADRATAPGVVIVNEAFVARHFPGQQALGRIVRHRTRQMEIVGIVADSRQVSLREPRQVPMAYGPLAQSSAGSTVPSLRFMVRSDRPDVMRAPILSALRDVDPRLTVEFTTVAGDAAASVTRERLLAWLGSVCALLGVVMAIAGVYGSFAYAVSRRRSEFGVRLALGATQADLVRHVMRDASLVLFLGLIAGMAGTFAATRLMTSMLFGISATDPLAVAMSVSSLTLVACAASYLPARRAALLDPASALRTTDR